MSPKRRKFTPRQKVQLLRQHFLENKPVSDVCDEHGINPVQFYRWQKLFFEKGELAFEKSQDKKTVSLEKQIVKLTQKLTVKNEVLSELMEAHVALKKNLGEI